MPRIKHNEHNRIINMTEYNYNNHMESMINKLSYIENSNIPNDDVFTYGLSTDISSLMPGWSYIYPNNIKKYIGYIVKRKNGWNVCIKPAKFYTTCKTEEDAWKLIKSYNIAYKTVKNTIYNKGNKYYCDIGKGIVMRFSEESLNIINEHIITAKYYDDINSYYPCYSIRDENNKRKLRKFHSLLCPLENKTDSIDHKNGESCDNRIPNLRSVPKRIQGINQKKNTRNTSGIIGVVINYGKKNKRIIGYSARWTRDNGKEDNVFFSCVKYGDDAKKMAAEYRKKIEQNMPSYIYALDSRIR